jgi:hypothetical protein
MSRERPSQIRFAALVIAIGLAIIAISIVAVYAYGHKEIDYTGFHTTGTLRCKGRVVMSKGIARFYGAYDKQIGPWAFYYHDGKTVEKAGSFDDNGEQEGEWKYYREDGSLRVVDHRERGQQVGESITYNEDGTVNCVTRHSSSPETTSGNPPVQVHTIGPPPSR